MSAKHLTLQPIDWDEFCVFVNEIHRHHRAPRGWKFGIAANDGEKVVGVVSVGRPVSRVLDNGTTLEVTRLATDGTRNACSFLYGAARRATFALGYKRLITYILKSESGESLRGAGWRLLGEAGGGTWDTPSRHRIDTHPLQKKMIYEALIYDRHAINSNVLCSGSENDRISHGAVKLGEVAPHSINAADRSLTSRWRFANGFNRTTNLMGSHLSGKGI